MKKNPVKTAASTVIIALSLSVPLPVGAEELSDPDLIRQAEEMLYNLNYDVGAVDGQISEETRNAVRRYQNNVNKPETGELNIELLLELREISAPSVWGALSAAVDGAWGGTWNYTSRAEAEKDAKEVCNKNTKLDCGISAVHGENCIALYHWDGKENWGYVMRPGTSIDKAKLETLAGCRENRSENVPCALRTVVCANGRHEQK